MSPFVETDRLTALRNVRYQSNSGKLVLALSFSGFDPGRVKTCASRECAELCSLFSSFDGDCQSGSFVIQRNRDKLSTRKFDVGVFTQPEPETDLRRRCLREVNSVGWRCKAIVSFDNLYFTPQLANGYGLTVR